MIERMTIYLRIWLFLSAEVCANLGWREREISVQKKPSSYSLCLPQKIEEERAVPGALIITITNSPSKTSILSTPTMIKNKRITILNLRVYT